MGVWHLSYFAEAGAPIFGKAAIGIGYSVSAGSPSTHREHKASTSEPMASSNQLMLGCKTGVARRRPEVEDSQEARKPRSERFILLVEVNERNVGTDHPTNEKRGRAGVFTSDKWRKAAVSAGEDWDLF